MEDPLFEQFSRLSEEQPSPAIHRRAFARILLFRYRYWLLSLGMSLAVSVILSSIRASMVLVNNDLIPLLRLSTEYVEFTVDYAWDFLQIIFQSVPALAVGLLFVNSVLILCAVLFLKRFVKELKQIFIF